MCPGHIHFSQLCTHARCQGFWAIRFDGGQFHGLELAGARAVVVYDTPQHMVEGGWWEALYVDAEGDQRQAAVEAILDGRAGGPWAVLGKFVAERAPTRYVPVEIVDEGMTKSVGVGTWLQGRIAAIRGRDREQPVRFENIFNQIHNSSQVLARGETAFDDGGLRIRNSGSHGLWSEFAWRVE